MQVSDGTQSGARRTVTDVDLHCTAFVNQNPAAFNDAFWDIAGVHVYA